MPIRELPPLRLDWVVETPSGKCYRWGWDEPRAENIPSGVSFSTTMPGGFEQGAATLPRKLGLDYSDLDQLSTATAYGAGGEVAWEGRLESAPRQSGENMSVTPGLVGWQAHLEDDQSAREIYVDRDLTRWGDVPVQRRIDLTTAAGGLAVNWNTSVTAVPGTGTPSLYAETTELTGNGTAAREIAELWYDAAGIPIGALYSAFTGIGGSSVDWVTQAYLSTDDVATTSDPGTDHNNGSGAEYLVATADNRKYAFFQTRYVPDFSASGLWGSRWSDVALYGNHGLTRRGGDPGGYYASDMVEHVVQTWCPLLTTDVDPSGFIIPHAAFPESTTAGEIVRQVTRFGLQDWGVWDDKTFVFHNRGARGRRWRARIAPSQLQETGTSIERLYESVIVQYQDVSGASRTVGPTGSGATAESADLKDTDTANPANQLGITKRALLQMGISTEAGATEVGRRFLEEQKVLSTAGQATLVGHVEDTSGVRHAAWKVRAGDTVEFIDASDRSARRVVRTQYDHSTRTVSVDLDAPPEGLKALLERLSVVLVPLGL